MCVVLIPAYKPDEALVKLVKQLKNENFSCLVVDDGSGRKYSPVFAEAEEFAKVLHIEKNGGKGNALKIGMSKIKELFPECSHFITADADGQHKVEDIIRVKEALLKGAVMVLTERDFSGKIPKRSLVGNVLSRWVYCILTGHFLSDNQSGLRGFAVSEIDWLTLVPGQKYDYEINMLYYADCQHVPIDLINVQSVYIDGNKSSHFNPIPDTVRIYKRLFVSAIGSLVAGLFVFLTMCTVTFTYGYNYCLVTVPVIGAISLFLNLGINALKFQKISYHDGGRTLLYGAFRYTYYTFGCLLAAKFTPEIPLVVSFILLVLVAVPVRFYLYQFAFSRVFFKGKIKSISKR